MTLPPSVHADVPWVRELDHLALRGIMSWSAHEPLVITAVIEWIDQTTRRLILDRDVLIHGGRPIHGRYSIQRVGPAVRLLYDWPAGLEVLTVRASTLGRFLRETLRLVPAGTEDVDVDRLIAQCLDGA